LEKVGINGGPRSENNVYVFHLPMVVPSARYTVKASVRMVDPAAKSAGTVWLREKPELP
jgi:hypothetical protein